LSNLFLFVKKIIEERQGDAGGTWSTSGCYIFWVEIWFHGKEKCKLLFSGQVQSQLQGHNSHHICEDFAVETFDSSFMRGQNI